ncbi:MAG: hypothetical protein WC023_15460, partial [Rhodocyclaceae bacterium]
MSTIQYLFQQAQLAEASYANFAAFPNNPKGALEDEGFSTAQATEFVLHWRVVDHLRNQSSGFSATVFESLDHPGQYSMATRGTEAGTLADLDADLFGIGSQGIALRQAIDLYNYRQSLTTGAGTSYQAAYLKTDLVETALLSAASALPGGYVVYKMLLESRGFWVENGVVRELALGESAVVLADTDLETRRSSATVQLGTGYDVVGHSLGGHLAMALGRLDYANVASVETFNPPFFDPISSDKLSDSFFTQLRQLEIAANGSAGVADVFKPIKSYLVAGDLVNLIGATRPGVSRPVFSEGEGINALTAHSMPKITDALAVYALFAQLDSSLETGGLDSIASILRASSAIAGNSLEATVAAVGKLFGKSYAAVETNRDDLYRHLGELQVAITGKTLTVVSLTNMTAGEIKAIAADPDMVATRYALKELNPFIVLGADYSMYPLTLINESTGQGHLSVKWIEDRSAMLAWKLKLATEDFAITNGAYTNASDQFFGDLASGLQLNLGSNWTDPAEKLRYIFGSNQADGVTEAVSGGSKSDRLYGMAGNDVLYGYDGADYLEGGSGDDTLTAGAGADILNGGLGYDTYHAEEGDTINDSDGKGTVYLNDKQLSFATRKKGET